MTLDRFKTQRPGPALEAGLEPTATRQEFLAFVLSNEKYALPLVQVREILKPPPITEVPRAAAEVVGIISVRGRITTIIDLHRRLRIDSTPVDKRTRILLVDNGDEVIGCIVDQVVQVYRLSADEMEMAVVVGADVADYVMGIGRPQSNRGKAARSAGGDEGDILVLLDPVALLKR